MLFIQLIDRRMTPAWNDWTSTDGGGSGVLSGEPFRDYTVHVRVKSNADMLAVGQDFESFDFFITNWHNPIPVHDKGVNLVHDKEVRRLNLLQAVLL